MARKPMKKFGTGGSTNEDRMRRKTDDIQSDYMKAQARNAGNTAKLNVAKAKFEQRMADAKDDMAKWSGSDRTATRKGEADAEAALTQARRTRGQSITDRDTAAAKATTAPAATTATAAKPDYDKMSFAKAFAAARGVEGKPNFPWRGKSYNTNLASNKPATPARGVAPAAAANPPAKPVAATPPPKTSAPAPVRRGAPAVKPAADKAPAGVGRKGLTGDEYATALRTGVIPGYATQEDRANIHATMKAKQDEAGKKLFVYTPPPSEPVDENAAYRSKNANPYARMNMKKGGTVKKKPAPVKKFAKGGSIDGCAIRGKTRAGRTK